MSATPFERVMFKPTPTLLRRARLIALVTVTAWLAFGCATPDVVCGVRADYTRPTPMAASGTVLLSWDYNATPKRADAYGDTDCWTGSKGERICHLRFRGEPPKFSNVCGLAKLGHEVGHAMHATHE